MRRRERPAGARARLLGWVGTALLLGILPIKLVRLAHDPGTSFAIGIAPSLLGPAGLLFLLLASTGWISRLGLNQVTLLAAAVSVALELAQLVPRPGWLALVRYTFDYLDLAASIVSVAVAYAVAARVLGKPRAD